jgi:hypothetical protein
MFDSSKDILNYILALSVFLFTVFLCWFIYYLIRMVRDTSQIIHDIRQKVQEVGEILDTLREKLTASASTVAVAAKGVERIVDFIQRRRGKNQGEDEPKKKRKG